MLNIDLTKLILITGAIALTGCGGGGGGASATPAASTPAASTPAASTPAASTPAASTSDSTYSSSSDDFDLAGMLVDIADKVMIPNYTTLSTATLALSASTGIDTYCSSIGTSGEAAAQSAVKIVWQDAVNAMQKTESHAVGPIANNDDTLRNRIHSYANVNLGACSIDRAVVAHTDADFDLSVRSSNQRGLGAIEYLLFNTTLTTSCAPQITETSSWDALTTTDQKSQRCTYASKVATDVAAAASSVLTSWQASGNDYRATFVSEGNAGASLQALTDVIIVHMDKEAKDRKVGIPTGVKEECSSFSCASLVEFPYTETSSSAIKNNLQGFRSLFTAGDGKGLDDLITERGYPDVTASLLEKTDAALANIDLATVSIFDQATAINDASTETQCTNSYVSPDTQSTNYSACALTGLMKRITDVLKIEFVTILEVNLPGSVQSDND
jgi:predicted lipoprotein|tara:strand:- start:3312 stop:4643 length:1332 start_codon:yes stop_codon:yes gene_type:complete